MDFLYALSDFMFNESGTNEANRYPTLLIFSVASGLMGASVVVLDWLIVKGLGKSALNLTHRGPNTLGFILIWGLGAIIGGYIGGAFGIFLMTRNASILVGVSWPLILPRLLASVESQINEDEEEQEEEEDA